MVMTLPTVLQQLALPEGPAKGFFVEYYPPVGQQAGSLMLTVDLAANNSQSVLHPGAPATAEAAGGTGQPGGSGAPSHGAPSVGGLLFKRGRAQARHGACSCQDSLMTALSS